MNRLFRKMTTRPVWWWETRRRYPIRSRFAQLPPQPVRDGGIPFVVLTTPAGFHDALWAAWSWHRFLREAGCVLQIAVDGALSAPDLEAAHRLFPGIAVDSPLWACREVCALAPECERFFTGYPTGRKLALLLALSRRGPLLYSDFDVLAFSRPHELLRAIAANTACYFAEEVDGARDPAVVGSANRLGLDLLPRFNSGFLFLPQASLPIELAARILAAQPPSWTTWYAEQTVLSIMLRQSGACALPPARYVISNRRQFYWEEDVDYSAIAARHFTGTVRHVLYKYGMPRILEQCKDGSHE